MAGFGPVGSTPVAALPSGGSSGVIFTITTGNITATGHAYTFTYNYPANRVTWVGAEVLHAGQSEARVTLVCFEVLRSISSRNGSSFMSTLW